MLLWLLGCAFRVPAPIAGEMAALPLVAPAADAERPYTLVDDRLWFVDTGASRTTCDDDLVAALGVEARPTLLRAHGEVGSVPIRRAVLRDVTIGGWTFRRLPCAVRDLATTSSLPDDPEEPVAGILGANLFRRFVVDLHFSERALRLRRDAVALPEAARVRRERSLGVRPVASLAVDGVTVPVVVDTGADRTYLPLTTGEELARYTASRSGTGPGGASVVEVVIRRVDEARLDGRPIGVEEYVFRRGRPGLLGMDALGVRRVVLDARRLGWEPGGAPRFLTPDDARRAALEADGSAEGLARLAAWEFARGDADRAVAIHARLGDAAGTARALLLAGRWAEGRATAAALGVDWARAVAMAEGAPFDAEVARRVFGRSGAAGVGPRLWALRSGADLPAPGGPTAGRDGGGAGGSAADGAAAEVRAALAMEREAPGAAAEVLAALAMEREAPGAAAAACARLPDPRDAEAVMLLVACGQLERARAALAGLSPGAVRPAGMSAARARAAWLDARARIAEADGDRPAARAAIALAIQCAPWDAYLYVRRAEIEAEGL